MESTEIIFDDSFEFISLDDTLSLPDCRHAAHCCIYAMNSFSISDYECEYEAKAHISMQLRFDGRLGFPGGIIDSNEGTDIAGGLNRELSEEINLDKKYFTTLKDHCFSHINKERNWCYHFFTKEVLIDNFKEIERNALDAEDYGIEVLGLLRVPLYTMNDGIRGFPAFLSNNFAGSAKDQLLHFLLSKKLMSYDVIMECLTKSQL